MLAAGVVFGLVAGALFGFGVLVVLGSMLSRFFNWFADSTIGAVFGLVVGDVFLLAAGVVFGLVAGAVFGFGAGLLEAVFADAALLLPLLFKLEALLPDFLFTLGFGILDGIISGVGA